MQFLAQFNRIKSINSGVIAFFLFLSVFGFKHITHTINAFEEINFIWMNKLIKITGITALVYFLLKEIVTKKINLKSPYFYLFVIFCAFFMGKLGIYILSENMVKANLKPNINALTGTIGFFLIGLYFPQRLSNTKMIILSFITGLILLVDSFYINFERFELNLSLIKNISLRGEYLMWSDTFAATILMLIFNVKSWFRYTLILIGFLFVAAFLSRAGLFCYAVAVVLGLIIQGDKKGLLLLTILSIVGGSMIYIKRPDLRSLKMGLSNNSSLNIRVEILNHGISSIKENWLTGDFLGQLKNPIYNTFGHYIHNHLSIWRQLGLVPFGAFIIYYFSSLKLFLVNKRQNTNIGVIIFFLVEIVLFRAYTFPYFWFIAGLVASEKIYYVNRINNEKAIN